MMVLKAWARRRQPLVLPCARKWESIFGEFGSAQKRAEFRGAGLRHEPPGPRSPRPLRDHKKKLLENAAKRRDPQILGIRDRGDRRRDADGISGRLGRSHRLPTTNKAKSAVGVFPPKRRRGRFIHYGIREHGHGGGHERHLPAWRLCPQRRDLPDIHGLCAAGDAARPR